MQVENVLRLKILLVAGPRHHGTKPRRQMEDVGLFRQGGRLDEFGGSLLARLLAFNNLPDARGGDPQRFADRAETLSRTSALQDVLVTLAHLLNTVGLRHY
ncbi:hypothetical protein [Bradyrhizobium canariense]|uniref:hypothetical protein n=1 Tax=Bradyrhizobium canariense TaxID=255045 RepID=UPI0011789488|nr:hypothetical protein [Bradyrhizobium canariense]